MVKTARIVWFLSLVWLSHASFPPELQQYATAADVPTLGYVGCQFSKVVCSNEEECIDDGLFGNCQKADDPLPDYYEYHLTESQRSQLEFVLSRLISFGYGWTDSYAQCIITRVLLTYRSGISYDLGECDEVSQLSQQGSNPDSNEFDRVYDDVNDESMTSTDNGISRDEDYENTAEEESVGIGRRGGVEEEAGVANFAQFLSGLSNQDISALEKYVADDLDADKEQEEENSEYGQNSYVGESPLDDSNPTNDYIYEPSESVVDKKDDLDLEPGWSRSDPVMITRVNVNYDPGPDSDAESGSKDKGSKTDVTDEQQQQQQAISKQQTVLAAAAVPSRPETQQPAVISAPRPAAAKVSPIGPIEDNLTAAKQSASNDNMANTRGYVPETKPVGGRMGQKYVLTMYVLCGLVGAVTLGAIIIYIVRRRSRLHDKLSNWVTSGTQPPSTEYQDLCRQHMQAKFSEKLEPSHPASKIEPVTAVEEKAVRTGSTGSSTSSWTEEPVTSNLDISTGHIVLAYMEDHIKNKDRLQQEWETLSAYDPEPCSIVAAIEPTNMRKNRYTDILPYEHSRVKLSAASNVSTSDFINASTIMDHDPRNPAYIATQGPLPHTVADFWQMIWEQGSVVIVNLTRLSENGVTVCHRYWPEEGSDLYHIYEVHLVSEHVWCEDYVIRSFYLKNLQTSETRTVTQFHFVAWPNNEVPSTAKTLLDFRRKVNKSFRCRSSPIIVHCSDGAGRAGTYCLIDMVLNRLSKGAKEIDIAATLEHIRDQRVNMVRTKEQFEFALAAVAQEVQAILHAPP